MKIAYSTPFRSLFGTLGVWLVLLPPIPSVADSASGLDVDRHLEQVLESLKKLQGSGIPSEAILLWIDEERTRIAEQERAIAAEISDIEKRLEDHRARLEELQRLVGSGTSEEKHSSADLWSLTPLRAPPIPAIQSDWIRTPIDAFILERLHEAGLSPSPEADRYALIRRLTYNLHGLPPTPEEIESFVQDPSPQAYENLVDRLLESPRYGERWGRHWLDVVHYADTHGYDKDKRRPNAWPYRDYVIGAFNRDKPYGRFIEEQIAGDVLFPGNPEGIVATGFIATGPWDFVGHVELREGTKDKKITRNLDRDDMVTNAMSTFQSLTVHCARCHDHKFDPIDQRDYYNLQAVFAGVDRANRPFDPDPEVARKRAELLAEKEHLSRKAAPLEEAIAGASNEAIAQAIVERDELTSQLKILERKSESPTNGYHSAIASTSRTEKWVEIDLGEPVQLERLVLFPARPTDFQDTPGFGFPARFRIEIGIDPQRREVIHDSGEDPFPNPGEVPWQYEFSRQTARFVRVVATQLWERTEDFVFALGEMQVVVGGENVAQGAKVVSLDSIEAGRWSASALVDGYDSRKNLMNPGGSPEDIEALQKSISEAEAGLENLRWETLVPEERSRLESLRVDIAGLEEQLNLLPEQQWVYAAAHDFKKEGSFTPPEGVRPVHVLARGDVERPLDPATPCGLNCVSTLSPEFHLENPGEEGQRRAALAKWLSHPDNPLTWRSLVNRVWHYHFGAGIVDTPNDFGHMGGIPSHPELLDWLAVRFRDSGQSLKELHRLILTSAVYRQSSQGDAAKAAIDSGNRLLWRMNRARLDAEAIRDSVLAISGKMDWSTGGPGYDLFGFIDDHSPHYLYGEYNPDDPLTLRRTVYRFVVRSVPDPLMDCLDCADPSVSVPVRNTTLNALQALSLLNNPFMTRRAEDLAERLAMKEKEEAARARLAILSVFAREASQEEVDLLVEHAKRQGWPSVCRVLFNANNFLFVD
jgi:hypothetical protein